METCDLLEETLLGMRERELVPSCFERIRQRMPGAFGAIVIVSGFIFFIRCSHWWLST